MFYISLLRGINVSGQKSIRMAELKSLYESMGFQRVQTYLQSGNILFESPEADKQKLATRIEEKLEHNFGFHVTIFIRTGEDLQRIMHGNPFLTKRNEDPAKLHVTFLYSAPSKAILDLFAPIHSEGDELFIAEQEIYLFCPNGYGRTKLSNNFIEKRLAVPATTRNWHTVSALCQMTLP